MERRLTRWDFDHQGPRKRSERSSEMSTLPLETLISTCEPPCLASLTFFKETTDGSSRAFWRKGPLDDESKRTNVSYCVIDNVPIYDLRANIVRLSLDVHGFQVINYPSACIGLERDVEMVNQMYLEETAQMVRMVTGAEFVTCYDLRYRENLSSKVRRELTVDDAGSYKTPDSPAWQVHVDHTKSGGYLHVQRHLSSEQIATYLHSKDWRVRVINIWRPVSGQVGDAPLAFCDYSTIDEEDAVPTDRPWNGIVAREIYNLKYNPKQRWYWIRDQVSDEATLFVNWDSNPVQGGAEFCVHASFLDSNANPNMPPRRSIEVRAIVITRVSREYHKKTTCRHS